MHFPIKCLSQRVAVRIEVAALVCVFALPAVASAGALVAVPSDANLLHASATVTGQTPSDRKLLIAIALPSRDPLGAAEYARRVSQVGDPLFRRYLTPAQYAARFGARQSDYDSVVAWAGENGLQPGENFAARTVLPLSGTVASFERAFGLKFKNFQKPSGDIFYEADATAQLPVAIASKISAVLGLSSYHHFQPMARPLPAGAHPQSSGTGPGGGFSAADLTIAYNIPNQVFAGKPQIDAVFEQGGFFQSDVDAYTKRMKLPNVPAVIRGVDGYGGEVNDPGIEVEAVLDIDMHIAVNPALKKIIVYEDAANSFAVALLDSFSAMATDRQAKSISVSYGVDEAEQGGAAIAAENTVLTQLAAQGQTMFVSAGDSGAYGDEPPNLNVSDPASQPFVTGVGGTTLFTLSKGVYSAEEVWNDFGVGAGATGGGISSVWTIPSYQMEAGSSVAAANGGSSTYRNVPDVASVANPLTGVAIYSNINGGWITIGGTSVSAPIWAGFFSLANNESEGFGVGPIGFANPVLYRLGLGTSIFFDFNDPRDGTNGDVTIFGKPGFNAGFGYDNTTGLGSFVGSDLMNDLALSASSNSPAPPGVPTEMHAVPTASSIALSWKKAKGDRAYFVFIYNKETMTFVQSTTTTAESLEFSNLKKGTYYFISLLALSKGGYTGSPPIYVRTLP